MDSCTEKPDVIGYHYYNGVSEGMAAMMPSAFTSAEDAMVRNAWAQLAIPPDAPAPTGISTVPAAIHLLCCNSKIAIAPDHSGAIVFCVTN